MNTLLRSPTIGLESIQRECLIVLLQTLNDELPHQDEIWAPLDEELANLRGLDYEPVVLEEVAPQNFYPGHRPSLIEAPVDGYPNVSVHADHAAQAEDSDQYDQTETWRDRIFVELMVKSETGEEEVNARVQRMADAVNVCMLSNPTLRGIVNQMEGLQEIQIGTVFPRNAETSYGKEWFWQGARLEYAVKKEAAHPSGLLSRPATQAAVNIAAEIDQS